MILLLKLKNNLIKSTLITTPHKDRVHAAVEKATLSKDFPFNSIKVKSLSAPKCVAFFGFCAVKKRKINLKMKNNSINCFL